MRNYIAVVFNETDAAYDGLHALWELDHADEITVHGAAVVHRDYLGEIHVDTKETRPALATAAGVAIGALVGALLGPVGAVAGAAGAAAAAGAAVGATTGAVVGGAVDVSRGDTRHEAGRETRLALKNGQSAVIAEVSEDWTTPIDSRMNRLGGRVYRRPKSEVENSSWYEDYYFSRSLYPYEYRPPQSQFD